MAYWDLSNRSEFQMMLNSTQSTTTKVSVKETFESPRRSQVIILLLLILIGTAANALALVASLTLVIRQRKTSNLLTIALTVTELFAISIAAAPTTLCYASGYWVGGDSACSFQAISFMFVNIASPGLTAAMTLERLFAVTKPYFYKNNISAKKTGIASAIILAFSTLVSLTSLATKDYVTKNSTGTYCSFNWASRRAGNMAFSIFIAIFSLSSSSTIAICNILIAKSLIKVGRRRTLLKGHNNFRLRRDGEEIGDKVSSKGNGRTRDAKVQMNLTKSVTIVSIANVICWTPHVDEIQWSEDLSTVQCIAGSSVNGDFVRVNRVSLTNHESNEDTTSRPKDQLTIEMRSISPSSIGHAMIHSHGIFSFIKEAEFHDKRG
eukprot:gene14019-4992_t